MKKSNQGTCALCRTHQELKNSHIIPEFLYKTLYDDLHRFHVLTTKESESNKMLQKGIREYLLCGSCENKLSKWEGYASQIFNGGTELMAEGHGDLVIVNGIDYKSFKLFQLSILWRAGVSSLTLFEAVKLGSYEETIRQMLLNEDAGSEDAFGCTVFCLLNSDHQVVTDVITPPIKDRVSNQICYRFIFNGFMWVYFVSKNKVKGISDGFLQKCGRFIFMYKNIEDLKSIRNFATEIYRQNKLGKN